jgi:hypothetical protein
MPYFSLWYRASDFTGGGGGESVEVDGVLQGRRRWHAPGEAVEVDGMLRGRRQRRASGEAVMVDGVLQGQRWQRAPSEAVKVEGEAIEWHRGRSSRGDDVLRG